ncbi:hypothetical protein HE1_01153 [Holospora elegans E1]|uniref:Uncharacterized protein n=1 Tax=Holospora elegans E1 TaxID=1427503 RepID=A0A023DZ45_9PROT|nr:hypothetical protein [Holospora elegans]GAJ46811.1 hypothetical protein HE1_01153 [Holospora elegans E1]
MKKAMRSIVYTAFYYDSSTQSTPAPTIIVNKNMVDLDKKLREDENARKKLFEFENVVSELTEFVPPRNDQEAERWRFLRSVIALDNAVYPEDTELSLPNIDRELKNAIAWKCLSICGNQYVNRRDINLTHINKQKIDSLFFAHSENPPASFLMEVESDRGQFIQEDTPSWIKKRICKVEYKQQWQD